MSLADDAAAADGDRTLAKVQRESIRRLEEDNARLRRELGLLDRMSAASPQPPRWVRKPKAKGRHPATLMHVLSDLHFDEVVRSEELFGVNSYNREIATRRLERDVQNTVELARDYITGLDYEGIVVPLLGDNFSGDIHEELTQTNEDTMLGSLLYWSEQMAAALTLLADDFGQVHCPVVVGNHGRRTRKPRAKFRARDNYDWFLGHLLARMLKADSRITFDVSEAADAFLTVYDTRFCFNHGETGGGNGIGGIWPPVMRLNANKQRRSTAIQLPYDHMVIGHWHQLTFGNGFTINGSMKGYDEYAFTSNFGFEPPQQALLVVTPEHGITMRMPVFCQDREAEGW